MLLKTIIISLAIISTLLVGFLLAGMLCDAITDWFTKHHR